MDTEKCRVFLTALDLGSFSAAAEKLGYTPSGISRAVDAMENSLGFRLATRTRHGITLTQEGKALLPLIRELACKGEQLEQAAENIRGLETGKVFVGTSYARYYSWLTGIISRFHESYPGISVEICEGTSTELSDRLDRLALDFALISYREGNHRWIPVKSDALVALLPTDHSFAQMGKLPVSEFSSLPFIEILPGNDTDNLRFFKKHGIKPNIRFSTSDSYAACAMVKAGLGISLVNEIIGKEFGSDVACVPLEPQEQIPLGIILPESNAISPAAKRFADFALQFIDDLKE